MTKNSGIGVSLKFPHRVKFPTDSCLGIKRMTISWVPHCATAYPVYYVWGKETTQEARPSFNRKHVWFFTAGIPSLDEARRFWEAEKILAECFCYQIFAITPNRYLALLPDKIILIYEAHLDIIFLESFIALHAYCKNTRHNRATLI